MLVDEKDSFEIASIPLTSCGFHFLSNINSAMSIFKETLATDYEALELQVLDNKEQQDTPKDIGPFQCFVRSRR